MESDFLPESPLLAPALAETFTTALAMGLSYKLGQSLEIPPIDPVLPETMLALLGFTLVLTALSAEGSTKIKARVAALGFGMIIASGISLGSRFPAEASTIGPAFEITAGVLLLITTLVGIHLASKHQPDPE